MAKRCVLVAFAVAGAALAAPSQLSQEPRAGWLHKAYVWLCSRHPQHRWCQHSGQQSQEKDILQEKDIPDRILDCGEICDSDSGRCAEPLKCGCAGPHTALVCCDFSDGGCG